MVSWRQAVELTADPDSLQASWTISPGQLPGEQVLSMCSCPDVEFTGSSELSVGDRVLVGGCG